MMRNNYLHVIFLLLSLALPFCVGMLWFQGQIYSAKENALVIITNDLEIENDIVLKFSIEEADNLLDWEHEREFEYKGEMYDLIDTDFIGDSVVYHCYHDARESELKRELETFVTKFIRHGHQNSKQKQHTVDFFKSLYSLKNPSPSPSLLEMKGNNNPGFYLVMVSNDISGPMAPPPRNKC